MCELIDKVLRRAEFNHVHLGIMQEIEEQAYLIGADKLKLMLTWNKLQFEDWYDAELSDHQYKATD